MRLKVNAKHSRTANQNGKVGSNMLPAIPDHIRKAYREFYKGLTKEQLDALGGSPHPSNLTGEINPHFKYSTSPDNWDEIDTQAQPIFKGLTYQDAPPLEPGDLEATPPAHVHLVVVLQIIRKILLAFTASPDASARLHGEVLALAVGFPGISVKSIASKHGITRQAISKRLRVIINHLGLAPTQRMLIHQPTLTPTLASIDRAGVSPPISIKQRRKRRQGPR